MALVTDMELPELDYLGPELKGERFHEVMADLAERSWLATSPIGFFVLDREAASYFLRTRSATFPGMKIAEMFEVREGPLLEEMRRNILHVNGDQHRRLRNLVNPAFTPRAADRWREVMREYLARLWAPAGRCRPLRFRRGFRQALPLADDRHGDGRPARGRTQALRMVESDPAPVRPTQPGARDRLDRARLRRVL